MIKLEEMLSKVTDFIHDEANTTSVVGKEMQLGEYTCVPVIRVGIGFGSGGGEKEKTGGGGAGGAVAIDPIGFLVSGNGEIKFIPTKGNSGLAGAINKVPDIVEKYFEMKKSDNKEEKK
jgi:uncharacterized spore protein YtfJ